MTKTTHWETRPDTRTGISRVRLGRGSKVVGKNGEEGRGGGAVYMTASVPIYWAGAVTQELLAFSWAGAVSPPSGGRGAGAVGGRAGAEWGAIYMTTSVACGWAGAVMRKLAKGKCYRPTDGWTDRPTR